MAQKDKKKKQNFSFLSEQEKSFLSSLAILGFGLLLTLGFAAVAGPLSPVVIFVGAILIGGSTFRAIVSGLELGLLGLKHLYLQFKKAVFGEGVNLMPDALSDMPEIELLPHQKLVLRAALLLTLGVIITVISPFTGPLMPAALFVGAVLIGSSSYEILRNGLKLWFVKEYEAVKRGTSAFLSGEAKGFLASAIIFGIGFGLVAAATFTGPFAPVVAFLGAICLGGGGYGTFIHGIRCIAGGSEQSHDDTSDKLTLEEAQDTTDSDELNATLEETLEALVNRAARDYRAICDKTMTKERAEHLYEQIQMCQSELQDLALARNLVKFERACDTVKEYLEGARTLLQARYASESVIEPKTKQQTHVSFEELKRELSEEKQSPKDDEPNSPKDRRMK